MNASDAVNTDIDFREGDWVVDQANPGQRGQFTGRSRRSGPHIMVELRYPDGTLKNRPLKALQAAPAEGGSTIESRLSTGTFGRTSDLRRLVTYEKLKGTLHEVVYSMEAAQIDFYPYQFKPVLKFINSPTERLIIADEVGLGKTIESALIWTELQARRQARRLLVVCPNTLMEKWRNELRSKFLLDAQIVDFRALRREIVELKNAGPAHAFVLIASYPSLRPPKSELGLLDTPPNSDDQVSEKTQFFRDLRHWEYDYPPFDLVVFDEAHYMRNAGTSTFHLGESISLHNDTGVLCVSATPVNNSNTDLHSLLRLIDPEFFETQEMFDRLLESNRPCIRSINALARVPADMDGLKEGVKGMTSSDYTAGSPLFKQFLGQLSALEGDLDDKSLLATAQDTAEKLNLLGGYINRTRRVQVEEGRPERRAHVMPVEYTPEEMTLYRTILHLVRRKCNRDFELFHVFKVLGLQLRAASCLPVIAEDIRNNRLTSAGSDMQEMEELLSEGFDNEFFDWFDMDSDFDEELDGAEFKKLLEYDFEAGDSKFRQLLELLRKSDDPKVIIFAYYRGTLAYLKRRLEAEGIGTASIHGGVLREQRWQELERFGDSRGPRVLLSSEVGSEGIDLQFSHTVVNYDLPWNPMRVEQRIGRIDRVGQRAKVLNIVNFKVRETVEERLYDRLHSKLLLFSSSLGDMEAIIGEEVRKLTVDLLSQELTPEEEATRMDQAERVVENHLLQIRKLEESGDSLIALSDYVQKKIRENREKGRYVQARELEDYLADFFERNFPGTELNHNTPANGCMRLCLSPEAYRSLGKFIRNDHSLMARPLHQREFSITFRRKAHDRLTGRQRQSVHFVNHLSPLIRWVTEQNRDGIQAFYNVSALSLRAEDPLPGTYAYRIERWGFEGLATRDQLVFAVGPCGNGTPLGEGDSELIVQKLLREGEDWDYANCDRDALSRAYAELGLDLEQRFDAARAAFEAENENAVQIRVRRAENHWNRLIRQSEKAIETMKLGGRPESMVRGRETRLRNERENKARKIEELQLGASCDFGIEPVAAGVFRVVRPES
jgi:SNF2 family DNA or RNA helicase